MSASMHDTVCAVLRLTQAVVCARGSPKQQQEQRDFKHYATDNPNSVLLHCSSARQKGMRSTYL